MAHDVKCLYCNNRFDWDKEPYVKVGQRYVHKNCFDSRQKEIHGDREQLDYTQSKKVDLKKCIYCNTYVDVKREPYSMVGNRYAHQYCYDNNYSPDEEYKSKIYKLLKEELHISYDYQQCERQRTTFITKSGYTNEGIYKALKYFYLVKKQSPDKSDNRIGIVPYVYEEAKEYYNNLEKRQNQIAKSIEKHLDDNPIEIHINVPEKRKIKVLIDLDQIGEDDDR